MKRLLTIILLCIMAIPVAEAQAPAGSMLDNSIERIDSLTIQFFECIPSHTIVGDSYTTMEIGNADFKRQMALLGSPIDMPYNNFVGSQIRYLLSQNDGFFDLLHERMQLYFPFFDQVLDKKDMPNELKYVSIIESALNPNAVSWCGATGLWQFMPYTGRDMKMRIDYSVDERKSILKSTEKACEYFNNSYKLFGDWLLAIASYNCGAGNVQRAINMAGGQKDFWKIKPYLPKETQSYVPKFIAAVYVMNYTSKGINRQNSNSRLIVPTSIDSTISIKHIAKYLDVQEEEIVSYNRELLSKKTPSNEHSLLLPYNLSMAYMENKDSIHAFARTQIVKEASQRPVYTKKWVPSYHYVTKGQTLYTIARRYGVTVYQLKVWNGLRSNVAPVGRNLVIYRLKTVNTAQQSQ